MFVETFVGELLTVLFPLLLGNQLIRHKLVAIFLGIKCPSVGILLIHEGHSIHRPVLVNERLRLHIVVECKAAVTLDLRFSKELLSFRVQSIELDTRHNALFVELHLLALLLHFDEVRKFVYLGVFGEIKLLDGHSKGRSIKAEL